MNNKASFLKYAFHRRTFTASVIGLVLVALSVVLFNMTGNHKAAIIAAWTYIVCLCLYLVVVWYRWKKYIGFRSSKY